MSDKRPFVFRGHPHYMSGLAAGESSEVERLVSGNGLVAGCSDLLAQAADRSTPRQSRLALLDAARERARAARVASDCCEAMVADVEAHLDAPAPSGLADAPRPGTPGLYRNPPVAGNAVVSHDDGQPSGSVDRNPAEPPVPIPIPAPVVTNLHPNRDHEPEPTRKRR